MRHSHVEILDENLTLLRVLAIPAIPCGLVVRISGFHPDGPGSIPGMGTFYQSTAKKFKLLFVPNSHQYKK